jgi:hypothetical protein
MKILFIGFFHQKKFLKKIGRKFIRVRIRIRIRNRIRIRIRTFSKVGSGSGSSQKSSGSATLLTAITIVNWKICLAFLTQELSIILQNNPKKQDKKMFCHINFTHLFFIHFASAILQPTEGPSTDKVFCKCDKWKVPGSSETNLERFANLPLIYEDFMKIWTLLLQVISIWK